MAFAGLGDAILYPILPVYGKQMGLSAFVVGVLLSINRFVRIISNTAIANQIRKWAPKNIMIAASVFVVLFTFSYALQLGLLFLLVARIV